jgi:hypothetical protein
MPQVEGLIEDVRSVADDVLEQIRIASDAAATMTLVGDRLVAHFVEAARASGHSWAAVGESLSVSRQAVQQRFDRPRPATLHVADDGNPTAPRAHSTHTRRDMGTKEHHGKYRALWAWLRSQTEPQVQATFSEIERVLGFSLPASSRAHMPHWYSYEGSAVARAIIDAGWRARSVDLNAQRLTLVREA